MSRQARVETPNAFARMTAALQQPAASQPATPQDPKPTPTPKAASRAATRQNTRIVAGHFAESMHRALRIAGAEEGLTMQQILDEALNDWLVKKGATKHLYK